MATSFYGSGPNGLWLFLAVTLVLGGAAAWVSGRAIAQTWRPRWQMPVYMLILAAGVRFVQFSVFGAKLLSLPTYLIDFLALQAICAAGYAVTRKAQMASQYGWQNETGSHG